MILFTRNLKTLHITGPYKVSAPLIRCDAEDILPARWLVFPPGPLCPRRDVTQAKHKAVFHGAAAYLASESMWDMPENKGASLRQLTGWAYPFHGPHIAPRPPASLILVDSWRFSPERVRTWRGPTTTWRKCKKPSDTTVRTQIISERRGLGTMYEITESEVPDNLLNQLNLWKESRFEFLKFKIIPKN